jgi:HAD superfamily hydrolase (TIGR01509 family)
MNLPHPIRAIIFDHDGTLVNSEPVHWKCWNNVLNTYGHQLSQLDYKKFLSGIPSLTSANWLVGKFTLDASPESLLATKQKHLNKFLSGGAYPLMPQVIPLLEDLKSRGIAVGVASGADRTEVEHSLKFHGIDHYFRAVATKNEVKNNKPAPDVYLHAAMQLGVPPSECIAIEDSDNGEQSARAANMFCVRLESEQQKEILYDPHYFFSFTEIHSWLAKWI